MRVAPHKRKVIIVDRKPTGVEVYTLGDVGDIDRLKQQKKLNEISLPLDKRGSLLSILRILNIL